MSMTMPDNEKRCTRCRQVKPLTAYTIRRDSRDGHAAKCKPCLYADHAIYRLNARDNPRIRDTSRLNKQWEQWEYRLIADYPDLECRTLAPTLQRSAQSIREARKRIKSGKVKVQVKDTI